LLERPFMAVVADEDVVCRFYVIQNVIWLLTMSRRWDRTKLLDFFSEASEEMRWIGGVRRWGVARNG